MSRLGARLDALRRESGAEPARRPAAGGDLAERLERLGADARARRPPSIALDEAALATRLDAERVAPGLLRCERHLAVAAPAAPLPGLTAPAQRGAVFVDTETSGLAGGTGTVAWMVGTARFVAGGLRLRQWLITGFRGEPALLEAVDAELAAAPLAITYNGGSFDLPLLRDRCRLVLGRSLREATSHRDLLHDVRRLFARHWPDCRLAGAEARLLGAARVDDLPGSAAPAVWQTLLRGGVTPELAGVLRHNGDDLLALARLLPALAAAYADPAAAQADAAGAAAAWLGAGEAERARAALEGAWSVLDRRGLHRLARLHRRAGRWGEAVACWQRLAAEGCPQALESLAKYQEHVARDPEQALALARGLPESEAARHRQRRLQRRAGAPRNLRLDLRPRP